MAKQPMLRMWFDALDTLPDLALSPQYQVRSFQPGDEGLWIALLQENGELGHWDGERAGKVFVAENGRVWRESIHFIMEGSKAVATACVQVHNLHPNLPELGWVAAAPDYRGKGLGWAACMAVLHFMRDRGYDRCFLKTNDKRLPAIKTYLRLGFTPDMSHASYPARWEEIRASLPK